MGTLKPPSVSRGSLLTEFLHLGSCIIFYPAAHAEHWVTKFWPFFLQNVLYSIHFYPSQLLPSTYNSGLPPHVYSIATPGFVLAGLPPSSPFSRRPAGQAPSQLSSAHSWGKLETLLPDLPGLAQVCPSHIHMPCSQQPVFPLLQLLGTQLFSFLAGQSDWGNVVLSLIISLVSTPVPAM